MHDLFILQQKERHAIASTVLWLVAILSVRHT